MAIHLARLAAHRGDLDEAAAMAERCIAAAGRTSDPGLTQSGMQQLAGVRAARGDYRGAVELTFAALEVGEDTLGDYRAGSMNNEIAWYSLLDGDVAHADLHAGRALELLRHDEPLRPNVLHTAAEAARRSGDLDRAWRYLLEAATLLVADTPLEVAQRPSILLAMACVRMDDGAPLDAALLFGAADAAGADTALADDPYRAAVADVREDVRAALGDDTFQSQLGQGAATPFADLLTAVDAMTR
jgi:tetratricopeptide (TPR) repeat protein